MPDRGQHVRSIAEQALALTGPERQSFLDSSCGTDEGLRSEVQALISAAESGASFMEQPAAAPTVISEPTSEHNTANHPAKIAHFTIRRVIGSGGMGTVYEGIQDNPRRKVAIKVMRHGVTSRTAQRRFEFESQILARLHHQGIAQIFEAGTWDDGRGGVPWFAMEYIAGAKVLTEFANAKSLGTRERLTLFTKVCDAVSHGHQKGIIHRDLKPGNILVDVNGQPKVIDFGVARATDSDMAVTTLQTDVGQLLGTVQYMSPEQCEADPDILDTRSDVYSLGVILYELLCDALPYDLESVPVFEAARVIREKMPSRPSTINRTLRGDVETIVLKALQKDREQRYQSAHELQRDIQRYLDNDPIEARPPSITYQLKVFARRNKGLFVSAAVIAAILIAATVVSIMLAVHATRSAAEAREAEASTLKEQERVKATQGFLIHVLSIPTPSIAQGRHMTPEDLLTIAGNDIDEWFKSTPEYREDQHTLIGYFMVKMGMHDEAEKHLLPAMATFEEREGRDHWKTQFILMTIAQMRNGQGHPREAEELSAEVEAWVRAGGDPWGPLAMELMVYRLEILESLTRWEECSALGNELIERMKEVQFDKINNGFTQKEIELKIKGLLGRNMMFSSQLKQDPAVRKEMMTRSWELMEEVISSGSELKSMGPRHPVVLETQGTLALCMWGNSEAPLQDVHDVISEIEIVHGRDSQIASRLRLVMGNIHYGKMQLEQSEQVLREVKATLEEKLDHNHPSLQMSKVYLGRTLARLENYEEAEPLLRTATEILSQRLEPDHLELVVTRGLYGMCLQGLGRFEEAAPYHEDFVFKLEQLLGPAHREPLTVRYLLTQRLFEYGNHEEALREMRAFLEHSHNVLPEGSDKLIWAQTEYGDLLRDMERHDEAHEVYEQAHADAMNYLSAGERARWAALSDLQSARLHSGDRDGALVINDQILADAREVLDIDKVAWGIGGRLKVFKGTDRQPEVDEMLDQIIEESWDDPAVMNSLAWSMVEDEDFDHARIRYPDRMLRISERACELTDHTNPMYLDTLARVHYQRGEVNTAISIQELALEHASEADQPEYQKRLARYRGAINENQPSADVP